MVSMTLGWIPNRPKHVKTMCKTYGTYMTSLAKSTSDYTQSSTDSPRRLPRITKKPQIDQRILHQKFKTMSNISSNMGRRQLGLE